MDISTPSYLLAIESSCDETACAIMHLNGQLMADVVSTQIATHAQYGGVVPEIASREHLNTLPRLVEQALKQADISQESLCAIAVTTGPGLIGSLFVGMMYAKAMALSLNIPLLGIHHLAGHLAIADLLATPPPLPHIALLVSGGHTALYLVHQDRSIQTLGTTIDDAAGEAFDKTAKMLGFAYPGGAALSTQAQGGQRDFVPLPIALKHPQDGLNMSFSGLKTAVSLYLQKQTSDFIKHHLHDICASIEHAIVTALVQKTLKACIQHQIFHVVIAGGVAANTYLRTQLTASLTLHQGLLYAPPKSWCTDNAVMIAACARRLLKHTELTSYPLDLSHIAKPYWPLV